MGRRVGKDKETGQMVKQRPAGQMQVLTHLAWRPPGIVPIILFYKKDMGRLTRVRRTRLRRTPRSSRPSRDALRG